MKYPVLLLVALNVVVFLWGYASQPVAEERAPVPEEAKRLVLLAEREAADQDDTAAAPQPSKPAGESADSGAPADSGEGAGALASRKTADEGSSPQAASPATGATSDAPSPTAAEPTEGGPTKATATEPDATCYRLGPFPKADVLSSVVGALRTRGLVFHRHSERVTRQKGYSVYIPAGPEGLAAARAITEDLEAQGFHDYYILGDGERENAVSVGVFSRMETATRRERQLAELGYEVTIEPRQVESTVYWIDYRQPPGVAPLAESAWRSVPSESTDIRQQAIDCKQLAE